MASTSLQPSRVQANIKVKMDESAAGFADGKKARPTSGQLMELLAQCELEALFI